MSISFALNHMVAPSLDYRGLLALAASLGACGVEFRNDFPHRSLFEGDDPKRLREVTKMYGVPILALSEVKMFNRWSEAKAEEAEDLMKIAVAAGIPAVSLIPANDGTGTSSSERKSDLKIALGELKPMLEHYGLTANIEALGFVTSSLRLKSEIVDAIEKVNGSRYFKIVHDTFHHRLAGEADIFPEYTGIVHISGVIDPQPEYEEMTDAMRVLINEKDRLGNIEQMEVFLNAGWAGAFSFEPFAQEIHELDDPEAAFLASMNFISNELEAKNI